MSNQVEIDNLAEAAANNNNVNEQTQVHEEFESIEAIYGEDCEINRDENTLMMYIPNREAAGKLTLIVHIPEDYPKVSPPIFELHGLQLSESLVGWAVREMETQFVPGEPCLFEAIEWLREQQDLWTIPTAQNETNDDAQRDQYGEPNDIQEELSAVAQVALVLQDEELQLMNEVAPKIVHGEPFTERKSTFQAHCLHVKSLEEIEAMMKVLLQNNKIRNATHNIMAYRIYNPVTNAFIQDFDDDGETAAGGRMLHMLQAANVRDAVVVVSRWFGGVLLGPSRFSCINNTARQLLEQEGYIVKEENNKGKKGKK
eukprot:TRINITY_DN14908_c3_g1_i1.p1 TRINITY_DN14908_c3_g1~~TRINITY_DN14908_c3_g1_i1.p1  ORF type:complete len:314 (+),score=39.07 TRINITY_DN14908_c3_g1_i1:101-1042(+)